MRESVRRWHSIVLQTYNAQMFESLIYAHNIITESPKIYTFQDKDGVDILDKTYRGFLAMKDADGQKTKYFLPEVLRKELPVRIETSQDIFLKESSKATSVISDPLDVTPFRIVAKKCWESNKEFIDDIAPFEHTEPDMWTLNKIIAIMGYIGKTFCGVCSLSEFGKSSIYLILDALTQKVPVFQPRSVPGVLAQITGEGNMVFDEVHDSPSDVKSCMENFSLQVGGNSPVYINGAMRSKNTKPKYDVSQQSISYLYNVYSNYSKPAEQFWDSIWSNKKAMQSRFLRIKLDGKLLEKFDKDFDVPKIAEENKMLYVNIAKHLLYLRQLKFRNTYEKRFKPNTEQIALKGRHEIIYNEIVWGIDLYSTSQEEYNKLTSLLDSCINSYKEMLGETVKVEGYGDC